MAASLGDLTLTLAKTRGSFPGGAKGNGRQIRHRWGCCRDWKDVLLQARHGFVGAVASDGASAHRGPGCPGGGTPVMARIGVIGDGGDLVEFVTTGLSARLHRAIGPLPQGRGILGLLISQPRAIRIANIAAHASSVGFPRHHPPMGSFLGAPVLGHGQGVRQHLPHREAKRSGVQRGRRGVAGHPCHAGGSGDRQRHSLCPNPSARAMAGCPEGHHRQHTGGL